MNENIIYIYILLLIKNTILDSQAYSFLQFTYYYFFFFRLRSEMYYILKIILKCSGVFF